MDEVSVRSRMKISLLNEKSSKHKHMQKQLLDLENTPRNHENTIDDTLIRVATRHKSQNGRRLNKFAARNKICFSRLVRKTMNYFFFNRLLKLTMNVAPKNSAHNL